MSSAAGSDEWIGEDERASGSIAPSVMSENDFQRHRALMQQPPRSISLSTLLMSGSYEMPVFAAEAQKNHFYSRFFGPRFENLRRIADKNNIVCNYQPGSEVQNII